jgi:hypothetical protein
LFECHIFKNIIRVLDDKIEKHREMTLEIIEIYLSFKKHKASYSMDIINPLIRFLI